MSLVGRATVWWLLASFFLLFVVMKLDGSIDWLWYVVFVPMWILDVLSVLYLIFSHSAGNQRCLRMIVNDFCIPKEVSIGLMVAYGMKLLFGLLLCAKLDGFANISAFYVFIPLWAGLIIVAVICCVYTWKKAKRFHNEWGATPHTRNTVA